MFRIRLKELREASGYSQAALADKLGVGQSAVGMWESGKNMPEVSKLEALAQIFNVSVDYMLCLDHKTHPLNSDTLQSELYNEIIDLTDVEKQDILDYIRFKKTQRR